jgi:VanZ family protein
LDNNILNNILKNKLKIVPSIAWAFFIMVVCLIPKAHLPPPHFAFEDLVVHCVCYGILALLVIYGLKDRDGFLNKNIFKIFIMMALYGVLIEVLQEVLPVNRTFSLMDMLLNSIGCSIVFMYRRLIGKFF